jgi:hypothetical protein
MEPSGCLAAIIFDENDTTTRPEPVGHESREHLRRLADVVQRVGQEHAVEFPAIQIRQIGQSREISDDRDHLSGL